MDWIVIAKALFFAAILLDGVYLGVLVHELGHASVALLATKQRVAAQVGTSHRYVSWELGRLRLKLGIAGFRYGATRYDRDGESLRVQRWVILGGPLASLLVTVSLGLSLQRFEVWSWLWLALFALFIANFRILIVSLWPIEYPAPDGSGEKWLSDGLDFWRLGKERK
ncbi:MAG: hypothetical protein CBD18_02275 [Opitutales bacterium TMED158]|nr:MAG: hypothetical protein CBD18_02275 [Opitutales bacterium TMED158]